MNGIKELFVMDIIGDKPQTQSKIMWFFLSNYSCFHSRPALTELSLQPQYSFIPKADSALEIKVTQRLSFSSVLLSVPAVELLQSLWQAYVYIT